MVDTLAEAARQALAGGAPATDATTTTTTEDKPAAKPTEKRVMSPEGRARISAAAKKRWRALRKAKKDKVS